MVIGQLRATDAMHVIHVTNKQLQYILFIGSFPNEYRPRCSNTATIALHITLDAALQIYCVITSYKYATTLTPFCTDQAVCEQDNRGADV